MTKTILTIFFTFCTSLILYVIRIKVVYSMHDKIIDAIFYRKSYYLEQGNFEEMDRVHFSDMESYNDTFRRWWDCSYKRILPSDKYELIKPFINKK